jgi:pimeloyl-ACP methyl ester carboxylesterase
VSIDGPHGGLRNVTGGDEQFLVFNVTNPPALRDNLRQSALELALAARLLDEVVIDPETCPGATGTGEGLRLDVARVALMGHSMGASIAPLAAAVEPRFGALLLSGAGGSFIENVVFKQSPLEIKPLAEALLGYTGKRELDVLDPVLSLLQWAADPADVPAYARELRTKREEGGAIPSVLMVQGIVDTYILPPIANAASLSLGLDLAGPVLDREDARLERFTSLADLLSLGGHVALPLPVAGNQANGFATRVVVQHFEDGIEDGHEVVFQRPEPKEQIRSFLEGFATGATWVPAAPP